MASRRTPKLQAPGLGVFDADEEEAVRRDGGAGAGTVAEVEEHGDVVGGEAAAADVEKSADEFADHVTEEGAAADGVNEEVGVGGGGGWGGGRRWRRNS